MANRSWIGGDVTNPGKWDVPANWEEGVVPVNGDDAFIEYGDQDIDEGLDQSAVTLASLTISQSYTGLIGFQGTFLQISATVCEIGEHKGSGAPSGSTRINLDLGVNPTTVTVFTTAATASDPFRSPVRLLMNEATSVVLIRTGRVSIADDPDDSSLMDQLDVTNGTVVVGDSVELNKFLQLAGNVTLNSGVNNGATPTATVQGGNLTIDAPGETMPEINVELVGGLSVKKCGAITALNCKGGVTTFTGSTTQRTVATLTIFPTAEVTLDPDNVTVTTLQTDSGSQITLQAS